MRRKENKFVIVFSIKFSNLKTKKIIVWRVTKFKQNNTRPLEDERYCFQQYAVANTIQDTFIDTWKEAEEKKTEQEGYESSLGRG